MTTLLDLATMVGVLARSPTRPLIEPSDLPVLRMQADVARARQILNFATEVSLGTGLGELWAWEQSRAQRS